MAKSKFGLGLLIGAVAGVLGGLFASDKPGKKLRKQAVVGYDAIVKLLEEKDVDGTVKAIFGEVSAESVRLFNRAKKEIAERLSTLSENIAEIEKEKYKKVVAEVLTKTKKDKKLPEKTLVKLKKYLEDDFKKITETAE